MTEAPSTEVATQQVFNQSWMTEQKRELMSPPPTASDLDSRLLLYSPPGWGKVLASIKDL